MPKKTYDKAKYRIDGRVVKGVTTLNKLLAIAALPMWGYKRGKLNFDEFVKYLYGDLESWEHGDKYLTVKMWLDDRLRDFSPIPLYGHEADAGTLTHDRIDCFLQGLPEPSTDGYSFDAITKSDACFESFKTWLKRTQFNTIATEEVVLSREFNCGGTIDAIGETSQGLEILDHKTGSGIWTEALIQVSAYSEMWQQSNPNTELAGANIVRYAPEGGFEHRFLTLNEMQPYVEVFRHLVGIQKVYDSLGIK